MLRRAKALLYCASNATDTVIKGGSGRGARPVSYCQDKWVDGT